MTPRLQVIGGGKMGEALVAGLVAAGFAPVTELRVVEKLDARADELRQRFPGLDVAADPGPAAGHVLAVKPGDVEAASRALDPREHHEQDRPAPVLSIAAGVTVARLEAVLAPGTPVVRAMPNTPALVGAGAAAVAAGTHAGEGELAWAEAILGAVGTVVRVPEGLLDAVTGLSGSGPAYVFLVAEALIEGGVLAGLPRPTATALATQTLVGAARLLRESGDGPEALRAAVTSPGGTTAAGLRALERGGVRSAFLDAVMD
ncbi:MAG TPA: pyrroline-5-carboxylate reductase, partial [Acidimicrobiales bacterium]|nr:pyrroline-5-carboxylate reductase [Acidimicrobiales bacterium]